MTLIEKFAALTPQKLVKFNEVKDEAALDAFHAENSITLTEDEKTKLTEFVGSSKLPLADEELDKVAGGWRVPTPDVKECPLCGSTNIATINYAFGVALVCWACNTRTEIA